MSPCKPLVCVVAPWCREADLVTEVLGDAGVASQDFENVRAAAEVPLEKAGALLVAEEELNPESVTCLAHVLRRRPGMVRRSRADPQLGWDYNIREPDQGEYSNSPWCVARVLDRAGSSAAQRFAYGLGTQRK